MLRNILFVFFGVLLLSLSGRISWEVGWSNLSIPITLQSIVLISMNQLYPKGAGICATFLWLLLATFGLPILADVVGGVDWIQSKSSGYLLGFLIAAIYLNRYGLNKRRNYTYKNILVEQIIGTTVILGIGFLKLMFHIGILNAFQFGILPFLFGGAIKIIVGALIVKLVLWKCFKKTSI